MNFIYSLNEKKRTDSYLAEMIPDMSRSHITSAMKKGEIVVNGSPVKPGYLLKQGDEIVVSVPEPKEISVTAEEIPLDIVYEDSDIVIINKPKDMVVHPAAGHYESTLVNALMFHCKDSLSGINGELRPGIVHRIDKDTTGLLVVCKNDTAHQKISAQLEEHSITRRYFALVNGIIREDSGTIDKNIERSRNDRKKMAVTDPGFGKRAVTHYRVLERFKSHTLVECRLETGRTHQIRVHMASIGHSLAGDDVYGQKKDRLSGNGQYLHAGVLGFVHPSTGVYMEFHSDLPVYFKETLCKLRNTT